MTAHPTGNRGEDGLRFPHEWLRRHDGYEVSR
jgi:hypothetical protein